MSSDLKICMYWYLLVLYNFTKPPTRVHPGYSKLKAYTMYSYSI